MKIATFLLLMASLSPLSPLSAQSIVIFGKNDVRLPNSGAQGQPADPAKAAFLAAVQAAEASPAPFDAALELINPPEWGRVVSAQTTGQVQIRRTFAHGFVFRLNLEHLLPNQKYILTLNGRPQKPGNEFLPESVPGHAEEKYYDFLTVTTDAKGSYGAAFAVFLHPGAYNVRFYVKDTADFKIVLYHDYFDISVL